MTGCVRNRLYRATALAICGGAWLLVRCNPGVPNLNERTRAGDAGGSDATSSDAAGGTTDAAGGATSSDAGGATDAASDVASSDAGGSDANPSDAAGDATDAASGGASSDAGSSDANSGDAIADSGGGEAASDAFADGNDAATGYCASLAPAPGFCADFDTGAFDSQFSFDHSAGTGSISSDATASVSPPNSFYATLGSATVNNDFAFMARVLSLSASKATYAFNMRVDAWPGGPAAGVVAAIVFNDGKPNRHTLSFYVTGTYAALEESFAAADGGTKYLDHQLVWVPKLGQWTRVSISIDVNQGTCTATIDGKPDLTNGSLASSWSTGALSLDLGLSYVSSQSAPWAVRYDNVIASWQ